MNPQKCSCCLLPAVATRKVVVGERSRVGLLVKGQKFRSLPTCDIHAEVTAHTFRILAGIKFQRRLEEVAPN